jgi:hypothetical protein
MCRHSWKRAGRNVERNLALKLYKKPSINWAQQELYQPFKPTRTHTRTNTGLEPNGWRAGHSQFLFRFLITICWINHLLLYMLHCETAVDWLTTWVWYSLTEDLAIPSVWQMALMVTLYLRVRSFSDKKNTGNIMTGGINHQMASTSLLHNWRHSEEFSTDTFHL